jgi:hypothetical protein
MVRIELQHTQRRETFSPEPTLQHAAVCAPFRKGLQPCLTDAVENGFCEGSPASVLLEAKYGGLEVSEVKRLNGLESTNAKLKKLLADAMLDRPVRPHCTHRFEPAIVLVWEAIAIGVAFPGPGQWIASTQ